MTRGIRGLWALPGMFAVVACATPPDDRPLADGNPAPISGGVVVDSDVPVTTAPVEGTTAELLAEMAAETSRLSALIADGSGDDESLARIVLIWERIRPEVKATRPGLVNSIGAAVELSETAVTRTRPADADKSFSLLTDLVDAYTGDG